MTDEERGKCHWIIHTAAVATAGPIVFPVPGLGVAADMTVMATMAVSLAAVFGKELTTASATGLAYGTMKNVICQQPSKYLKKELAKVIPFFGQAISAGISVALTEAAGWQLADSFDRDRQLCLPAPA